MYEKFQQLLNESQKTPYRVSKETGISTATLSNWKHGNYTPKQNKLKVLADYFGVSVDYFVS
ncbi:helix-turn-helix transcriptional regulator [Cohnella thailandensis]|uniref:Helix-turn-helix transcriptional regulator n=1 Tax=Cohnella thailandensis TaxID=557557 RepID=A0A841SRV4_9BACL|nr:helix-turn-helix transcriptional regulator [Cohnella thailandensis]